MLQFLGAVFWSYYTGVGGVVSLLVEAWKWQKGELATRWHWWWVFAVLGVLLASYQAWSIQLTKRIAAEGATKSLQGQLDALNEPIITGRITQRFLMNAVGQTNPDGTPMELYVAEVQVENSGASTVLTDWNVGIISDEGTVTGVNCVMPEDLEGTGPFGFKVRILRQYMLQEKTSHPIERGGMRTGWLVIQMPSDAAARLWKKGAVLQAVANDAFGHTFAINYVGTGPTKLLSREDMLKYVPGSDQIFYLPSPTPTAIPTAHSR